MMAMIAIERKLSQYLSKSSLKQRRTAFGKYRHKLCIFCFYYFYKNARNRFCPCYSRQYPRRKYANLTQILRFFEFIPSSPPDRGTERYHYATYFTLKFYLSSIQHTRCYPMYRRFSLRDTRDPHQFLVFSTSFSAQPKTFPT